MSSDIISMLIIFVPIFLLSTIAQMYLRSTFSKWHKVRNSAGLSGIEVGQLLINRFLMGGASVSRQMEPGRAVSMFANRVSLERSPGVLTDHYDPRTHTVRLSDAVATRPSVVAMAVVAHELGHAQQHAEQSFLITLRSFLLPAVQFSPQVAYVLIFLGIIFNAMNLLWLGVLFYGLMTLFAVLTLPVEIDASLRALRLLRQAGLLRTDADTTGSQKVLTAAAGTYLAAAIASVLQLIYFMGLARRG